MDVFPFIEDTPLSRAQLLYPYSAIRTGLCTERNECNSNSSTNLSTEQSSRILDDFPWSHPAFANHELIKVKSLN